MTDELEPTICYTYKVEMIVQVLAKDMFSAADHLDKNGGYVSDRKIELLDSVQLISKAEK
jgi:hypothetical protein